ncbi:metallophosphoesterase [Dictyobacter arantiisoli]|uniref:Putative metallophosphoesterase YkuE n=1 Tax=Dictyobacter arantiisoli TaxID=2014874 RepID=A0A5A5T964_9CHLR|nr:metallophosphoesterase [Dictyobacter arantiisoli]GCF08031.1 putative metallophosphoesterase YkuE [Dictyobacter arantiisoli]
MSKEQGKHLMVRRAFLKGSLAATAGVGVAGAGTLYYAHNIEPTWFDLTHYQFHLPRLTSAFHGYRLLHITDIHADNTFMTAHRLVGLVETINTLQADMIVITGDFVTDYLPAAKQVLAELRKLHASDGVFGVLGNHDHPSGVEWVRECLQSAQVTELPNQTHTLRRGSEMLHLVGLDDLWPSNRGKAASVWTHQPLLQELTDSLPAEGAAILLVHEPDFADVAAANGRFDLELSGHSHGGQVRIPFYGPLILPQLSHKYPLGLYHLDKMLHYTNRGLGMLSPHFRLSCRPEIAIFEFLHP